MPRIIHSMYFSLPRVFWKDTKNIMVIGIIAVSMFLDKVHSYQSILFRLIRSMYFSVPKVFWKDTKNIMVIRIIAVTGFIYILTIDYLLFT